MANAAALSKSIPISSGLKMPNSMQAIPCLAYPTLKEVYKEAILNGCAEAKGK